MKISINCMINKIWYSTTKSNFILTNHLQASATSIFPAQYIHISTLDMIPCFLHSTRGGIYFISHDKVGEYLFDIPYINIHTIIIYIYIYHNIIYYHNHTSISIYNQSHIHFKKSSHSSFTSTFHTLQNSFQHATVHMRYLECLPHFMTSLPDCPFCSEQGTWLTRTVTVWFPNLL